MENAPFPGELPKHPRKVYHPADRCIYCGARDDLTLEHIVPLGFGGSWEFPKSSCKGCAKITGAFEGKCLRTIFGPLRMTYRMKTRRKNERPSKLPLKVKFSAVDTEWQDFLIDREEYPYVIVMPKWQMPDDLSGYNQFPENSSATKALWVKGSPTRYGIDAEYEQLCQKYGFFSIMPTGTTDTDGFCRLLGKVAHSFATAELGDDFQPYLNNLILRSDMKGRHRWIGTLAVDEEPSNALHEVSFDHHTCDKLHLVSVRIRLMALFGTPTYYVVTGQRL